jgi:type IX secretion system PorP/SprF family membrane protein
MVFLTWNIAAQDIHFSQTTRSSFQMNPAFTGAYHGNVQATINWKDQWQSVNKTFRTYSAQIEYAFGKGNPKRPLYFAVGGLAYKDVSGDIEMGNSMIGMNFSTLIKVNRHGRFILGVQSIYGTSGLNTSAMQWGSQYNGLNFDPSLANGEGIEYVPFKYWDLAAGVAYWFHKEDSRVMATSAADAKIGFAIYHLNRPEYSHVRPFDPRLPFRYVGHFSSIFTTRWHDLYWFPNLTGVVQGKQHEILVGSLWKYRLQEGTKNTGFVKEISTSFGADLRVTNVLDAVIPQLYLNVGSFSVGLSYDINVSYFRTASQYRGGFEFSLRFTNPDAYLMRNPFRNPVAI